MQIDINIFRELGPFVEVFVVRPYIFADTHLRRTCRPCWRAWVDGPGEYLCGEYELRCVPRDPQKEYFSWDRVNLMKIYDKCTSLYTYFEATSDRFMLTVTVATLKGLMYYTLFKYDISRNIRILLTSTYLRHHVLDISDVFDPKSTGCGNLSVVLGQQSVTFRIWLPDADIIGDNTIKIIDHNLSDIYDFMLTSRLNLVDFLPRYTQVQ